MPTPRPTSALLLCACLSAPAWAVSVPVPLPTDGITDSASGSFNDQVSPGNLLNGSGLDANQAHDNASSATSMWHSAINPQPSVPAPGLPASPAWVRFDFAKPTAMDAVAVWNHNQSGMTNRGFRDTVAYGTTDGKQWFVLGTFTFKQAKGQSEEAQLFPLATQGKPLNAVILAAKNNYGGNVYGLSEVRFAATREVDEAALPLPADMAVTPQSAYRHLADGSAGREVILYFKGPKLQAAATLDMQVGGKTVETLALPATLGGCGSLTVLLPAGLAVKEAATVNFVLHQGKKELEKTAVIPAQRQWTVFVYPHSHVDIGYTNTHENVEIIHKRNVVNGIRIANATADRTDGSRYMWNPEVTWPVERYLKDASPEQAENVYKAIRQGRLVLDASYVNTDTSVCAGEELFQLLREGRKLQKKTGATVDTFVQVDVPGVSWGLVPVLNQSGVKYIFSLYNGGDRTGWAGDVNRLPFWWTGPDGKSKVLFYQPGDYRPGADSKSSPLGLFGKWIGVRDPNRIPETIKTANPRAHFLDNYLFSTLGALDRTKGYPYDLFAVSWALADNTPLDEDLPEAVRLWNQEYAYPHLVISSAHDIMSAFEKKYGDQIPMISGDYTEYWTDGLGTAAKFTSMNRNAKERLIQADALATMLNPAKPAPRKQVDEIWRNIVLGSEHTWCYCNPNDPYFQEAIWKVKRARFQSAQDDSTALLGQSKAQVPAGPAVAVMNTLSWARGGLVTLAADASKAGDRVVDEAGVAVPSQRLSTGELAFLADSIPALGSRLFRVQAGPAAAPKTPCTLDEKAATATNGRLILALDPASGNIASLRCADGYHEFVNKAQDGGLNAFRQLPGNGQPAKPDAGIKISVKEKGPLVVEWQVDSVAPGCKSVARAVRLVAGQPWLECANTVDKLKVTAKEGIHFGFAFNVPDPKIHADIPWGVMRVDDDQMPAGNRNWIAFQRWLDVSDGKVGVTWASLDAPTFEVGAMTANILGSAIGSRMWLRKLAPSAAIYSWALNNHWHTNFPLFQEGQIPFRYRVMPHAAGYDPAQANHFGMEQTQPLVATPAAANPIAKPVLALKGSPAVVVETLKGSEDGKATILRLRSVSATDETVKLTWPASQPKSVNLCPLDEDAGAAVGDSVTVPGNGFVTLRAAW